MARYALVFSTTAGYMPGTNGILNALEHYGMAPNVDVYVILVNFDLPQEYKDQWPDVSFEALDPSFWPEQKNAGWYCRFAPPDRALELLNDYEAVQISGADVCPLNDYTAYFDLAVKTRNPVLSTNEQGCADYSRMTPEGEWPYVHTWMVPYADIPAIFTPSQQKVLALNLQFQEKKDSRLSWMDGLNYALRDWKQEVNVVPGNLWVFNLSSQGKVIRNGDEISFNGERMNSFHRKHWIAAYARKYLAPANENCQHNHLIFNQMWNFFNRECRVVWTEGVDDWDGK